METNTEEGKSVKNMFKSKQQNWQTPKDFYDKINQEFNFDFDPCPVNPTFNGLEVEWGNRNFINPPYKTMLSWIKKGIEEYKKGKLSVFLLPVRTETKYFHELIMPNAEVRFIRGKLKFGAPDSKLPECDWCPAPFASMIVIFNPTKLNSEGKFFSSQP